MIEIFFTPKFNKKLHKISKNNSALFQDVLQKINEFKDSRNHKNLKTHKIKGIANTYSFSANYSTRIIFEYGKDKNIVFLLTIGNHDDVY